MPCCTFAPFLVGERAEQRKENDAVQITRNRFSLFSPIFVQERLQEWQYEGIKANERESDLFFDACAYFEHNANVWSR